MRKLKIVIAGASGFVGQYLIESLLKRDCLIVALSRKNRSSENKDNSNNINEIILSNQDKIEENFAFNGE